MGYSVQEVEGRRFGHLTAIRFSHRSGKKYYWLCRCDCGKECYVSRHNLVSGKTRSCGHLRSDNANMTRGHFRPVNIDDNAKRWIIKHYIHTKNQEIKDRFGLTDGWLHRFARENGLKKSTQFIHKCQRDAAEAAKASHIKNGTYPPKGYGIPGKSANPIQKYIRGETKKQKTERVAKMTETMRSIRRSERIRMYTGQPRKTKLILKLTPDTRKRISLRHNLRELGYIVPRGSDTAYYDENTRRSATIEGRKPGDKLYCWFEYKPISEMTKNDKNKQENP